MRQLSARVLALILLLAIITLFGPEAAVSAAPTSTAHQSSGLFVIDQDHHSVDLVKPGKPAIPVFGGLTDPVSLAVDSAANIYVIDEGTHSLIKRNGRTGLRYVVRADLGAATTSMALDDHDNLYIHDRTSVLKYSSTTHLLTVLGTAPGPTKMPGTGSPGQLTVDGAGNASVTSQSLFPADELEGVTVKTFPAQGGPPTSRTVHSRGYFFNSVESRSGTIYVQTSPPSIFLIDDVFRIEAGTSTASAVTVQSSKNAFAVDRSNNFYLMQIRTVCPPEEIGCRYDYSVDSVSTFAPGASEPTLRPITDLQLPAGGFAVSASGTIYAAVIASADAEQPNTNVTPVLVRIDPGATKPVVLANGHFSDPTYITYHWTGCTEPF